MSADLWMPFYVGDYLGATRRLSTEQHGAYLLLMLDYWKNGPPPDDATVLARITGLTVDAWSIAQAVLRPFFRVEDGHWHHKRIDAERERAGDNKRRNSERASKAAKARWDAPSNAPSKPQAMLKRCPSPSPSPSIEDSNESSIQRASAFEPDGWQDFVDFRKKCRKPLTPRAAELALAKLAKLEAAGSTSRAVIEQSILNGWTGLFAVKEESSRNGKSAHDDRQPDNRGIRNQMLRLVLGEDAHAGSAVDPRRGAIHGAGELPMRRASPSAPDDDR